MLGHAPAPHCVLSRTCGSSLNKACLRWSFWFLRGPCTHTLLCNAPDFVHSVAFTRGLCLPPSLFSLYCSCIQGFKNIKLTKTPKGQRVYSKGWGSSPLTSVPVSCVSFQRQSMYRKALTCMYPLWNLPGNCAHFYDSLLTSWFWDTHTAKAAGLPHAV